MIARLLHRLGWALRSVRVPIRLQFQTTECGVAALAMVLAHHGRHVTTESLREITGASRDCVNAAEIARAARHFGLECRAYTREPQQLADLPLPFLAHLRFIHFVVVEGFADGEVLIADPASGRNCIPAAQFEEAFTGVVLSLTPGPAFQAGGGAAHPVRAWWARAGAVARREAGMALGAGAAGVLAVALLPVLLGRWVDAHVQQSLSTAVLLLPVLAGLAAVQSGLFAWARRAAGRLQEALTRSHARDLAAHFLAMPPGFFAYRLPSRLHDTLYAGEAAAGLLCRDLLPELLRAALALLAVALMAALHPAAGVLAGALLLGQALLVAATLRWHRRSAILRGKPPENMQSLLFSRSELELARFNGYAREFIIARLGGRAGTLATRQEGVGLLGWLQGCAAACACALPLLAILQSAQALAAQAITPGTALALVLLAGVAGAAQRGVWLLWGPCAALVQLLLPVQDVLESAPATPAPAADAQAPASLPDGVLLQATELAFGYSSTRPPLVREVSLALRRGEQLGITGPSGGGKSTLGGLLTGDLTPWSGRVAHAPELRRAAGWSVARVDKAAFFFEGTVRENLCLWDAAISELQLERAVRDACLEEVLAARPGGLAAPVAQHAGNFSGGQRQRMEIARALLREPQVLVLDEATDALDPALEARLRANLRARGCTLVMISHRASTLAGCDRVLRVAGGRLHEAAAVPQAEGTATLAQSAAQAESPAQPAGPPVLVADDDVCARADRLVLQAGLQRIGAALDALANAPASEPSGADLVSLGLRAGLLLRRVRFVDARWWARNYGPLLACRRADARVVVWLPAGSCWLDAASGAPLAIDPARDLHEVAWRCTVAADAAPLPALARLGRQLRAVAGEWWAAGATALLSALVLLAVPLLAARAFVPASHSGPVFWAGAAAALLAAGLLEMVLMRALLRIWSRVDLAVVGEFVQRLPRLAPALLRTAGDHALGRSLGATEGLVQRLSAATRPGLEAVVLLLAWAFLASLHPGIALLAILVAVVVNVLSWRRQAEIVALEEQLSGQRAVEARFLYDTLAGLARLRLLGSCTAAFAHWQDRLAQNLAAARPLRARAAALSWRRIAFAVLCLALLPAAFMLLPGWVPGALVPLGSRPWLLPACFIAFWLAMEAALSLGQALQSWQACRALARQADLVWKAPLEPAAGVLPLAAALELQEVRYAWPGTSVPALRAVSLRLAPGEFLAITGPSGGGKSTLLRLMLGLEAPDAGSLRLGGAPLEGALLSAWQERTGLVAQGDTLGSAITLRGHLCGMAPVDVRAIWSAVEAVQMGDDVRRMPMGLQTIVETGKLSTGQEQRLLIARELLRRPRLLVLDEATNAIPDALQARLFAALRSRGITCVLVTHRESAIALMDRVVVVREGAVAWSGTPDRLAGRADLVDMLRAERQEGHL